MERISPRLAIIRKQSEKIIALSALRTVNPSDSELKMLGRWYESEVNRIIETYETKKKRNKELQN